MKYKTRDDPIEFVGENGSHPKYNRTIYSFPLRYPLVLLYCAFLLFSPSFLHVRILSMYQKAPDDNLIRGQREVRRCVWHRTVDGPGRGG